MEQGPGKNIKSKLTVEGLINYIDTSVEGLIFDMDGTLTDSNPAHLMAWNRACSHFGFTYPREKFYYYAGLPSDRIAEDLVLQSGMTGKVDPAALSARKEMEFHRLEEMVRPVTEVFTLLKHFHGRLPVALGTGRRRTSTYRTLEHLDLLKYFDIIVTSDDVEHPKPAPDTFLRCAAMMGLQPEQCLVFEDAARGLETCSKNMFMFIIKNILFGLPIPMLF